MQSSTPVKILCTGNPKDFTVARAVKQVFPTAEFSCRSTGYDLRMWELSDEEHFKKNIKIYNLLSNYNFTPYYWDREKIWETLKNEISLLSQ